MPQDNSAGVLTGLIFVALFLAMIASIPRVTKFMQAAPAVHALTGSSRPVK